MKLQQMSSRGVAAAAMLIAAAATLGVLSLGWWAQRAHDAELRLVALRGEINGISALEWEAVAEREVEDKIEREIVEHRTAVQQLSSALRANPGAADVSVLLQTFARYLEATDQQFAHIRAGRFEDAFKLDKEVVDPMYESLHGELDAQAEANRKLADRVGQVADAGVLLSLLGAALAIGMLFVRFSNAQARQTAQLAQALDDLQRAQDQMAQNEKLAALGQLIAGIAHEINTPLGAIRAAAGNHGHALEAAVRLLPSMHQLLDDGERKAFFALLETATDTGLLDPRERRALRRELTPTLEAAGVDDARGAADLLIDIGLHRRVVQALPLMLLGRRRELLGLAYDLSRLHGNSRTILQAVERASKVVFALKSYVRIEPSGAPQPVALSESLETVLDLYASQLRHGVSVERRHEEMPPVNGQPDELVQVWTNLLHNAVQAMDGQGRLLVSTERDGAGHAVVRIGDSGPGIPAEVLPRIFEAFFTTKPRGEGSGLGLHICRKIIERHGGTIDVETAPGHTVFSVRLPLVEAPAAATSSVAAPAAATRTPEETLA